MNAIDFKTWDDVCEALGIDPVTSLVFADHLSEEEKAPMIAFYKLSKLSKASYGDKQPDWSDSEEYKWWPYFDMDDHNDPSGFGFSYTSYGHWSTNTNVGSRLCFPSKEMAKYAGTQFIDWYRDLMVLPKISQNAKEEN